MQVCTIADASCMRAVDGLSISAEVTTGVNWAYGAPNDGIALTVNSSGGCNATCFMNLNI